MIYPSVAQVLRCTSFAMETLVKPAPGGKGALSAVTTATHLLRYLEQRLALESAMLSADIAALRPLLGELRDYLHSLGSDEAGAAALAAELAPLLIEAPAASRAVPELAAESAALREALCRVQRLLQGTMRARRRDETGYRQARERIRGYIAADLQREAALIEPAFGGRGPRR